MPLYVWSCRKCGDIEIFRPFNEYRIPPKHPHPLTMVLSAPMVITDIEPYLAIAGDKAGQIIGSRQEHKAFLRRNKLVEFGNEPPKPQPMRKTIQKREILETMRNIGVSDIIRRGSR